jgi:sec-independent protein translocase protein TatB
MFGIDSSELLLIALVALVVIGPKDLPKAMRVVGYWVGKARGISRQFRSGFDQMVREAELEEMEKRWAAENARIMAEHPPTDPAPTDVPAPQTAAAHGPDGQGPDDAAALPPAPADIHPDETQQPVMVEKPHVAPAVDAAPAPARSGEAQS